VQTKFHIFGCSLLGPGSETADFCVLLSDMVSASDDIALYINMECLKCDRIRQNTVHMSTMPILHYSKQPISSSPFNTTTDKVVNQL
jgi:hypothetical protein